MFIRSRKRRIELNNNTFLLYKFKYNNLQSFNLSKVKFYGDGHLPCVHIFTFLKYNII